MMRKLLIVLAMMLISFTALSQNITLDAFEVTYYSGGVDKGTERVSDIEINISETSAYVKGSTKTLVMALTTEWTEIHESTWEGFGVGMIDNEGDEGLIIITTLDEAIIVSFHYESLNQSVFYKCKSRNQINGINL